MANIVQLTMDTIQDADGNIVQRETRNVIRLEKEPNYIKLYLDNILYLSDLPSGLNTILLSLLKRMQYNNKVVVNSGVKREIIVETGLSMASINNAITKFVKNEILVRQDTGIYLVNPHLFGKGEWKDIEKIRLEVIFDPAGKSLKATIDKKN